MDTAAVGLANQSQTDNGESSEKSEVTAYATLNDIAKLKRQIDRLNSYVDETNARVGRLESLEVA